MSWCLVAVMVLSAQAYALEVPVSQTEAMIDGKQTLIKVFEVPADTDPQSLVEYGLSQNGYTYAMTSIVKDTMMVSATKEMTQEETITINVSDEDAARLEALMSMPAFIDYNKDGYVGKLYPVISSLKSEETGRTSHSGYKTTTKTYTFDYNDDSLVPSSSDGGSLSSVTWSEGDFMDGSSIPENYVATANYKKYYSYSTVDGYAFTLTYSGEVEYEHEDKIRYTITYTGTKIVPEVVEEPSWWERTFGKKDKKSSTEDLVQDAAYTFSESGKAYLKSGGVSLSEGERIGFGSIGLSGVGGAEKVYIRVDDSAESVSATVPQGSTLVVTTTGLDGTEYMQSYPNSGTEVMYLTVDKEGSVQQTTKPATVVAERDNSSLKLVAGIACILIAVAGIGLAIFLTIRYIVTNTVDVYTRDDVTGNYTKIKSIRYDHKTSSIHINPLDNPSVTNYRFVFKPALAAELKGKVITIDAGKNPVKHQVGDAGGNDYVTEINI